MAWVHTSSLPKQHPLSVAQFPRLDGGLNLSETEERLRPNESPELLNLWWEDGCLQSRPGQRRVPIVSNAGGAMFTNEGAFYGGGFAVTDSPFFGFHFLHMGSRVFRWDGSTDAQGRAVLLLTADDVPMNAGTFFRFGDSLFYKNQGAFLRFTYSAKTGAFQASSVAEEAFVPTILINADPSSGAGDAYQPENRLTGKKRVTYTPAVVQDRKTRRTGDGAGRIFAIGSNAGKGLHHIEVYVNGVEMDTALYDVNLTTGHVTFTAAPEDGANILFVLYKCVSAYRLPVRDVQEVCSVSVDGVELRPGEDYGVHLVYGEVYFTRAPAVTDPPSLNSVEIVYRKENYDSKGVRAGYKAVMDCTAAAVCGEGNQLCIVLGGCPAQPNAVFWSGNSHLGLDPSYWPFENYNLVGDTEDPVTGFGKQYGELLVFKARSVGKLTFSAVDLDGRDAISLSYSRVNDKIGCDLPGSIQLIENNLVFASSTGGLFRVRSSSPAYENNIDCISGKVNGSTQRPGLLDDLRSSEGGGAGSAGGAAGSAGGAGSVLSAVRASRVSSLDDGRRYLLCVNGHVWVWDYSLSSFENPVWFRWTGFSDIAAWFTFNSAAYHIDRRGRLTRLSSVYSDYGEGFPRVYQFPVQLFGAYDRLKDVLTAIIALREEEPSNARLFYLSDYEKREDLTPLHVPGSQAIAPRNLTFRDLSVRNHPAVFRRRPGCRHVRHFSMRLENHNAGENLAVLYAEIQVRMLGRDR